MIPTFLENPKMLLLGNLHSFIKGISKFLLHVKNIIEIKDSNFIFIICVCVT
ncbi:hypothetical protein BAN_0900016 [Borrelia anserina BA2]|uniref:Uncharacterized protein n=1 Tax=Borrelia anserina BA2 TaxID=1313293 RepID=W5SNM7_BORAN|nr:hypothetical protein BAN_0900016 [Borrelia anserina BA2]